MLRLYNVGIRNSFISHQLPYHEAVVVMERPLALKHNYFHLPLSLSRVSGEMKVTWLKNNTNSLIEIQAGKALIVNILIYVNFDPKTKQLPGD